MKKTFKMVKRFLKVTLVVLCVLVFNYVSGIFQWLASTFDFLPAIPWLPELNTKQVEKTTDDEINKADENKELNTIEITHKVTAATPTEKPKTIPITTVTTLVTSTVSETLAPSPSVEEITTTPNTLVTSELKKTATIAPEASIENTANEIATTVPIVVATLPPTKTPVRKGNSVFFTFDEHYIEELLKNNTVSIGNITLNVVDRYKIVVVSQNDDDFVDFHLTRKGFSMLIDAGISKIEIPFRAISLSIVYQQIQETNTDIAEFKWFFEEGEYKYKAVIKNILFDWLRRFPHNERFLIIE